MKCPFCDHTDTRVVDSRWLEESNTIKRRRRCDPCQRKFTTFETIAIDLPQIIKRDGRREKYLRSKVFESVQKASQKRPIGHDLINSLVDSVERTMIEIGQKEVSSLDVGKEVMTRLRKIDPVAYVRFASVYKTFQDVDEFVKDIGTHEEH